MTSEAVVWTWLPGAVAPVPAGRLRATQGGLAFAYARSYLDRADAISLYGPELPLRSGPIEPLPGLAMPSCLRDGSPDAWGRRVIATRMTGNPDDDSLTEVDLMLLSGSNRIGANDFQARPDAYVARSDTAPVADLLDAAERLDAGERLPAEIAAALVHGTSVGGARPKILLRDNGVEFLAKLSSSTDRYPVVKAEAAGNGPGENGRDRRRRDVATTDQRTRRAVGPPLRSCRGRTPARGLGADPSGAGGDGRPIRDLS